MLIDSATYITLFGNARQKCYCWLVLSSPLSTYFKCNQMEYARITQHNGGNGMAFVQITFTVNKVLECSLLVSFSQHSIHIQQSIPELEDLATTEIPLHPSMVICQNCANANKMVTITKQRP